MWEQWKGGKVGGVDRERWRGGRERIRGVGGRERMVSESGRQSERQVESREQ